MSGHEPTTWRELLASDRGDEGDTSPLVHVAPDEAVLDVPFDAGYGSEQGPRFLAWSEQRVYFPACYDGSEWVASAPRNPQPDGQEHIGGG